MGSAVPRRDGRSESALKLMALPATVAAPFPVVVAGHEKYLSRVMLYRFELLGQAPLGFFPGSMPFVGQTFGINIVAQKDHRAVFPGPHQLPVQQAERGVLPVGQRLTGISDQENGKGGISGCGNGLPERSRNPDKKQKRRNKQRSRQNGYG